jgi:transcriptional regulator with PAS, ATPase and Fis domain
VRELKSAFEYAFVACSRNTIGPEHLPPSVLREDAPANASHRDTEISMDIETLKKQRLEEALRRSGGNRSEAARILGISRTSVWNQIKRYGIDA